MSGAETVCEHCGKPGIVPEPHHLHVMDARACGHEFTPRTPETREAETVCEFPCPHCGGRKLPSGKHRFSQDEANCHDYTGLTRTPETQGGLRLDDLKALYREAVRQNSHLPSVAWQKVIELIERIERLESGGPLDGC